MPVVMLELITNIDYTKVFNWKKKWLVAGGMSSTHKCNSCHSRWYGVPSPPEEWDYEGRVDWCIRGKCCRQKWITGCLFLVTFLVF